MKNILSAVRRVWKSKKAWLVLLLIQMSYLALGLYLGSFPSACEFGLAWLDLALILIALSIRCVIWIICIAFTFMLLMLGFLFFLSMMRKASRVICAFGVLFLLGFCVYLLTPRLAKTPEIIERHAMLRSMSAMDTVLGSFFLSRGSYDEFSDKATDGSGIVHVLGKMDDTAGTRQKWQPGSYAAEVSSAALYPIRSSGIWWNAFRSGFWLWICEFAALAFYYLFHTLCYASGIAFIFRILSQHLVNAILIIALVETRHCSIRWLQRPLRLAVSFVWRVATIFAHACKRLGFSALPGGAGIVEHIARWRDNDHGGTPIWVFWGGDEEAQAVAKANESHAICIYANTRVSPTTLLFLGDSTSESQLKDWKSWVYARPDEGSMVAGRLVKFAKRHWFLGRNSRDNVQMADDLLRELDKSGNAQDVHVYVRVDSEENIDIAFSWADSKNGSAAQLHILREPEIIAATLLSEHPMLDAPGVVVDRKAEVPSVSGDFNILLIGCGALGQAVLRQALQGCVFPGVKVSVDIVDMDDAAYASIAEGYAREQGLWNSELGTKFEFHQIQPAGVEFNKLLDRRFASSSETPCRVWNRVFIALPQFRLSLQVAMSIAQRYRERGLLEERWPDGRTPTPGDLIFFAAKTDGDRKYFDLVGKDASVVPGTPFGSPNATYWTLAETLDRNDSGAKCVNWCYCNIAKNPFPEYSPREGEDFWRTCKAFDKESSRASAMGMKTLVRLLGWRVASRYPESSAELPTGQIEKQLKNKSVKDYLAQTEHLRWMVFHLLKGVRSWKCDFDGNEIEEIARMRHKTVKPNDMKARNRHAALAPVDKLSRIDNAFMKGNKGADVELPPKIADTDARFVEWLPKILGATGWQLRDVRVSEAIVQGE